MIDSCRAFLADSENVYILSYFSKEYNKNYVYINVGSCKNTCGMGPAV